MAEQRSFQDKQYAFAAHIREVFIVDQLEFCLVHCKQWFIDKPYEALAR